MEDGLVWGGRRGELTGWWASVGVTGPEGLRGSGYTHTHTRKRPKHVSLHGRRLRGWCEFLLLVMEVFFFLSSFSFFFFFYTRLRKLISAAQHFLSSFL